MIAQHLRRTPQLFRQPQLHRRRFEEVFAAHQQVDLEIAIIRQRRDLIRRQSVPPTQHHIAHPFAEVDAHRARKPSSHSTNSSGARSRHNVSGASNDSSCSAQPPGQPTPPPTRSPPCASTDRHRVIPVPSVAPAPRGTATAAAPDDSWYKTPPPYADQKPARYPTRPDTETHRSNTPAENALDPNHRSANPTKPRAVSPVPPAPGTQTGCLRGESRRGWGKAAEHEGRGRELRGTRPRPRELGA